MSWNRFELRQVQNLQWAKRKADNVLYRMGKSWTMRLSTAGEVDRTLDNAKRLWSDQIINGEYYGLVPFVSIISTVNALRSNIAYAPFTVMLQCNLHLFYLRRLIMVKRIQLCWFWIWTWWNRWQLKPVFFYFVVHCYLFLLLLRLLAVAHSVGRRCCNHRNLLLHGQREVNEGFHQLLLPTLHRYYDDTIFFYFALHSVCNQNSDSSLCSLLLLCFPNPFNQS